VSINIKHISTCFAELHYVLIGLALVGKMCITGAFGAVYILSAEIYPTVVRNAGMGSSSAVARIGSMIAPYIAKSVNIYELTHSNVRLYSYLYIYTYK